MEKGVFAGRLELDDLAAMVTLMRYEGYDWIMLVAVVPETPQIGVLTISRNGETERRTLPPIGLEAGGPAAKSEEARSQLPAGAWVAIGLGGAGVAFGGLYGYESYRLRNDLVQDQDSEERATRGAATGCAGMIVSMTGAAVSAGLTWFGSRQHHKEDTSGPLRAQIQMAFLQEGGGFFYLEGTW